MEKNFKNKILIVFLLSLLLLFSFPKETHAFIDIFGFFEAALEGVEEKVGPISGKIILILFLAFGGFILLWISASALQWIISHPEYLTLENPVVKSGLYFTTGLVNLFIILFFVAIAIAWILKIETFAAKKALPKLILVALLVNFVRIFVGIPIDIATIIHRTILPPGENLVWLGIDALLGGVEKMIIDMASWVISLATLFMLPFIAPFAQFSFLVYVLTVVTFLPSLLDWLVKLILMYLLSILFLTMAFIFAARIFVIWFLAIFAPLAFLCIVLPQTEKYWKEWLHHLFSMCFFGILVLLFLVVGFRGARYLYPGGLPPTTPILGLTRLPEYFPFYFFFFVFVSIATWLSKKTAPELANFLISSATAFGGMMITGLAPVARAARRAAALQAGTQEAKEKEWREKAEKEKKAGKQPPKKPLGLRVGGVLTKPLSWGYRLAGTTPGEEIRREMGKGKAEGEKIRDPELLASKIKWAMKIGDLERAIGYLSKAIEKGGGFKKEAEKEVKVEDALRLIARANTMGAKAEAERIAYTFIPKIEPAKREDELRKAGFKSYAELTPEEQAEWDAKGYRNRTITQKIIGDIKPADVKQLGKEFWKDPEIMEAAQNFWGGPQIRSAAEEFGRYFAVGFSKPIEEELKRIRALPPDEAEREYKAFIRINPKKARYLETTAAQELGFVSPYVLAPDRIKERYRNIRDVIAERPIRRRRRP